jgi:hypothetical protein
MKDEEAKFALAFILPPSSLHFGARGRGQTFNIWFVGPALYQLSYSGKTCQNRLR